jgi:ribosomal protein S18 acetylase RimI-like enzyme
VTEPHVQIAELKVIESDLTGITGYLLTTAWPMASIILLNDLVYMAQLKWMALLPSDFADERISWLHVVPDYRQRGLARRVLEIATAESNARGWIAPERLFDSE